MSKLTRILTSGVFLMGGGLFAQEKASQDDALYQELLDILNTKVTVASKKAERTADAAATITSYTAPFLEQLGITTLGDLAEITPGYSTFRIYGERVFETRGQKAGSFNNNRHLVLVDGIPVHNARNYKAFTEEELPLQFADRVEFLRGPASSLYGIGAFFGVVSITPKSSPSGTRVETLAGVGSDASSRRVLSTISHGTGSADTLFSMGYFQKGDSLGYVGTKDDPNNVNRDGRTALFMYASHKIKDGACQGLTLGSIFSYKTGGLGEHWNWGTYTTPLNNLTWGTFIPYVKYEHQISKELTFNSYLKFNESQEKGVATPFGSFTDVTGYPGTGGSLGLYDIRIANYEALAELQWSPTASLDVVGGVNYDVRWQRGADDGGYNITVSGDPGNPYKGAPVGHTGDYKTTSFYLQAKQQFPVLAGLSVVGGLRLDRGDAPGNSYSQLSPRVGVVLKGTDRVNFKVLYGTALRGPGIKEVELNNEKKVQNPGLALASLNAEKFNTVEVAATYTAPLYSGSLTWFTNKTTDTLDPSQAVKGAFVNTTGTTKASGVEAEFRFATTTGLRGWLNGSMAKAEDPSGLELNEVPVSTGSAGLTYQVDMGLPLQCSAIARYQGAFRVSNPVLARPEGGTFFDVRVALPPTKGLGVSLEVRNVTDKVMKYPKAANPDVPSPRRAYMVNVHFNF